jgi:hypothetical protein
MRVRLVASCQGSQRRTFSFLGRRRNCSRFSPSVVGPHSVLSGPNSRPTAPRTLSYDGRRPAGLEAVAQALRLRQRGERVECGVFDLPDPLTRDAEGAADLVERSRLTAM